MALISLFEVIGPNMVGPSSSHTAGAASMALLARRLFPGEIKKDKLPEGFVCPICGQPASAFVKQEP